MPLKYFNSENKVNLIIRNSKKGQTDRQTDMAISTRLLMLIKNIYTFWGLPRLLLPVTHNFFCTNVIDPFVLF